MSRWSRVASLAPIPVIAVLLGRLLWRAAAPAAPLLSHPIDFNAFYCGGQVLGSGLDPYREGPLRACEAAAYRDIGIRMEPYLVVPAPFPPYVLWAFAALALFPFGVAERLWFVTLLLVLGLTVVVVRQLTTLPLIAVAAALFCADGIASLVIGQLVPLVVLGLAATALALRKQRYAAAAAFGCVTLLEPHLGVPVCVSLMLWAPPTRKSVAAIGVVLATVSLTPRPSRLIEYVTQVLPAQGRIEGGNFTAQYSATALIHALGAPLDGALIAGTLGFFVMFAFGIVVAKHLARSCGDPAYIALAPPAFVLCGGAYVHIHQFAAALPLGLALYGAVRSKAVLLAALLALAVPWQALYEELPLAGVIPHHHVADPLPALRASFDPKALAQSSWDIWARYRSAVDGRTALEAVALKVPTWFGIVTICWLGYRRSGLRVSRSTALRSRFAGG
ncbi:MAG: hypothetical protein GIX03_13870 [Candidatus Eremiobacteraeota bacterium]|nr:hypothetical protein [Candidatus Eremiobacteraeota bacterium]